MRYTALSSTQPASDDVSTRPFVARDITVLGAFATEHCTFTDEFVKSLNPSLGPCYFFSML
jgi:hypothetical protein